LSRLSFFFFLLTLCLVSCRNDSDTDGPTTTLPIEPPQIDVDASLFGIVQNVTGEGISDASIIVDGIDRVLTDQNGVFLTSSIEMNQYGSHITVVKDGYLLGSTFVQPQDGQRAYTEITLIEKSLTESFEASQGKAFRTNGEAIIDIPANAIEDNAGNVYDGIVNAYTHWYDPSDTNLSREMPGDLRALDSDQEFTLLATYGMIAVELEDESGNPLNIAEDKKAELTFPVPSSLLDRAPENIPLWHFDEGSGYWLEDGSATLVDGKYIGEVSHFSFWNCDVPNDFVELSGQITGSNGEVMSNLAVSVLSTNYGEARTYTDADGNYGGKVPINEPLTIRILDLCGSELHTEDLGSLSDDLVKNISVNSPNIFTLSADLFDCNDQPVDSYLKIELSNNTFYASANQDGNITFSFDNCSNSSSGILTAYDLENLKLNNLGQYFWNGNSLDIGAVKICDDLSGFITYTMNGETSTFLEVEYANGTGGPTGTFIRILGEMPSGGQDTLKNEIWMDIPALITGDQNPNNFYYYGLDDASGDYIQTGCVGSCPDLIVEFTEINDIGELVKGRYEGQVVQTNSSTTVLVNITGEFELIREQ